MRPHFTLLLLVLTTQISAQPIDPHPFQPLPEPSVCHGHSRSGRPSAPLYYLTDTIVVQVTGHVMLDGGCGSGTPLYGFQRKEGDAWVAYLPPINIQLCCGMPSAEWMQHTVALVPGHVAQPAYGKPWIPGEYRVLVLLVGDKELVGPAFTVVKQP